MALVDQQNATIDGQRTQLAQQNNQLEVQRRQIEELTRQLQGLQAGAAMQATMADQLRAAQDAFRRAQDEAARARAELESCRANSARLQTENETLQERTRRMESALKQLKNDCLQQRSAAETEIDRLSAELHACQKEAERGSLTRELQMREMMQTELHKSRQDSQSHSAKLREQLDDAQARLTTCETGGDPCRRRSGAPATRQPCMSTNCVRRPQMQMQMQMQPTNWNACVPPGRHVSSGF